MFKEEFFTRVAISYRHLLTSSGASAPCLRDYCRIRHVAYRDFIHWASTHEIASDLLEAEGAKKRLKKIADAAPYSGNTSPLSSGKRGKHILYPLRIIPDSYTNRVTSVVEEPSLSCSDLSSVGRQSILRGVRVIFPNGVRMFVKEADGRSLYCLIHGDES